ncbi:MAG: hypothetical protein DI635_01285 [Pseudoxanthomonas suwonensis]|nr:MAG: hypothetical protein DI635_01285 [Pseudoxanthomonas suwonensis]
MGAAGAAEAMLWPYMRLHGITLPVEAVALRGGELDCDVLVRAGVSAALGVAGAPGFSVMLSP